MVMEPYYDYDYSSAADSVAMGIGGFFLVFILLFYLLIFAFAVVSYIFTALGMYTIARRRGIHHAWLAWIPIGDYWLLGSISDQYQYVAKGRVRNRRKVLLGLSLGMIAVLVLMMIALVVMLITEAVAMDATEAVFGGTLALVLLGYITILIIAIVLAVFYYIALYDLFTSCDTDSNVLYLVLSILFPVALPFFIFACRNKDKGMPPRKAEPKQIPVPQDVPAHQEISVVEEPAPACEDTAEE